MASLHVTALQPGMALCSITYCYVPWPGFADVAHAMSEDSHKQHLVQCYYLSWKFRTKSSHISDPESEALHRYTTQKPLANSATSPTGTESCYILVSYHRIRGPHVTCHQMRLSCLLFSEIDRSWKFPRQNLPSAKVAVACKENIQSEWAVGPGA